MDVKYYSTWLALFMLFFFVSLGNTQPKSEHAAFQRALASKKFKEVLTEILRSTNDTLEGFDSGNHSSSCFNHTLRLLHDRNKLISLLMRYFDAAGKPPSSVSLGNLAWMGSFDLCQDIPDAHYCVSNINFNISGFPGSKEKYVILPLQWGACFPKPCESSDHYRTMQFTLAKVNPRISMFNFSITYKGTVCPVKPTYTTGVLITLTFCGLLLLLCLLGTIIDVVQGFTDSQAVTKHSKPLVEESKRTLNINTADNSSLSYFRDFNDQTSDMSAPLTPSVLVTKPSKIKRFSGGCLDFLLCFSLLRNSTKIFDTNVPAVAITSINGIRVISMFWIILGHTFLFMFISSLMENPVAMLNDNPKLSMMAINNAYFAVDSFFFLSGLLVAYTGFRKLEKADGRFNWIVFYVHRYFRLTPSLMFVILFYAKLMPYLIYSPVWYRINDKLCGKYWWTNLIYINNFYPTKFVDECVGWTWYLANDMQFFVITPPLLILAYRFGWRGLYSSAGSLLLASSIVIASLIGYYNIDPMTLGKFNAGGQPFGDPMKNIFENKIYDKPYCRIQPYLVGFFLGYYMHRSYSGTRKPGWIIAISCWVVAAATGLSLVYAPHNTVKVDGRTWSKAENVIYGTSERFLWGVVLAWVIYACHYGYAGLIQRFLSAKFWIPLSRLTYSAYLVHPMVLTFMFSGAKSTIFYSSTAISYYFIAGVVLAYGAGFILAVTVEFPCDNLENLALKCFRIRT